MADKDEKFIVRKRYFLEGKGWRKDDMEVKGTYEEAGRAASAAAHDLDEQYGGEHFWTVDLINGLTAHCGQGSYFQLFHGRLS